jgi:tetratricopeptide (TPR) repeat protein
LELFDRDAALQAYTQSLRLQPGDPRTRLALGRFYQERGETSRAIEHLRAAIEADPALRAAYPLLGRAYQQSGDLPSAASILKSALDRDPADQESRYALARVLLTMGREDEGRTEMERYDQIRAQVATAERSYQNALTSITAGKLSEAENTLREAVRLAPNYGPALQSLGALLLDRGSPEKALGFLERSIQLNPLNAATWFSLGAAYAKSGRLAEALEAAKRAVALNDDNPQYQKQLNDIQARLKR